jgi:hypothetical protein
VLQFERKKSVMDVLSCDIILGYSEYLQTILHEELKVVRFIQQYGKVTPKGVYRI